MAKNFDREISRIAMERDDARAAIQRVIALHSQDTTLLAPGKWCPACGDEVPCRTIRALGGEA